MQDVYKNINKHSPGFKWNVLIVLDDMIADMISNKKLNQIVRELSIRRRKLNISTVFITQSYYTILFPRTKRCLTKMYTFFYYKNSKQSKALTNYI